MNSRVARIAVKLRVPESERDRASALRSAVEQVLLQQALDELERIVHDTLGSEAIVRARAITLRWQIDADSVGDNASALELGRDLAESLFSTISALPREERLRPAPHRDVVVFEDEDHAIAAYLADGADGRAPWFHAPRSDAGAEWSALLRRGAARTDAVRTWLERMDARDRVLRWLDSTDPVERTTIAPSDEVRAQQTHTTHTAIDTPLPALHTIRATAAAVPGRLAIEGAPAAPVSAELAGVRTAETQVAGVWYLARLVLEIELAELLWQVGVREADFLAHVVAAVVGVDDIACRWFGGAFDDDPALDAIAPWAESEIDSKLSASFAGLAIDMPRSELVRAVGCVAPAADARTAAVVARCAAALVSVFCARLGVPPNVDLVRKYLCVPARMELDDPLCVVIPMERINIDLRRAGVDRDPGYLAWLRRKVVLQFED